MHFEGESSGITRCICLGNDPMEDLSRMLKNVADISEPEDMEITLNITIWKGK